MWVTYSLLRIALFAVPFAVLMLVGVDWIWAALVATIVSFCASYIFLRRQRDAMANDLSAIRRGRTVRTVDDDSEDAAVDRDGSRPQD